jgi:endonuclease/exonuclease/phosphatase family metal-dependent hydrolase
MGETTDDHHRASFARSADGMVLRVVSLNIRNGRACDGVNSWPFRRGWVPDYIRGLDADVVGLQEAYASQVVAVQRALSGYACVGVGRDNGKRAGEFCPIYVRSARFRVLEHGTFWLSDTPDVPGSRTWGNTLPRICTWALLDAIGGARFRVCNLHLDHASPHARMLSVGLLRERVAEWAGISPVVVMGDFNAGERDPAMSALLGGEAGLRDTFRAVHPDAADVGTFHGWKGARDGAKIDYILATPDVTVLDAAIEHDTVRGRLPSDHWPVTALIRIG